MACSARRMGARGGSGALDKKRTLEGGGGGLRRRTEGECRRGGVKGALHLLNTLYRQTQFPHVQEQWGGLTPPVLLYMRKLSSVGAGP